MASAKRLFEVELARNLWILFCLTSLFAYRTLSCILDSVNSGHSLHRNTGRINLLPKLIGLVGALKHRHYIPANALSINNHSTNKNTPIKANFLRETKS